MEVPRFVPNSYRDQESIVFALADRSGALQVALADPYRVAGLNVDRLAAEFDEFLGTAGVAQIGFAPRGALGGASGSCHRLFDGQVRDIRKLARLVYLTQYVIGGIVKDLDRDLWVIDEAVRQLSTNHVR